MFLVSVDQIDLVLQKGVKEDGFNYRKMGLESWYLQQIVLLRRMRKTGSEKKPRCADDIDVFSLVEVE